MKIRIKYLRRLTALFLAILMVAGSVGQNAPWLLTSYASELPNNDLGEGASGNIGYKWMWNHEYFSGLAKDHWGGDSVRYDLTGLKAGQLGYDKNNGMMISYANLGFPSYLAMAGPDRTTAPGKYEDTSGDKPLTRWEITDSQAPYDPTHLVKPAESVPGFYLAKLGQRDSTGNSLTDPGSTASIPNGAVEKLTIGQGSDQVVLESRITTTPSPDNKYVFVDYYLQDVSGKLPTDGRLFWLASPFDLRVNGKVEDKAIYKTKRGFYALNTVNKATADVVIDDASLDIDGNNMTKWIGVWQDRVPAMMTNGGEDSTGDKSLAFSWEFKMYPYQTIHKRVAFANKEAVYYVSSLNGNDDSADPSAGTFKKPYKTIDYAIAQCKDKNAYIFIQDYAPIDKSINLVPEGFSDKTSIVISSADIDKDGNPLVNQADYIKTLKRKPGFIGSLFQISPGSAKATVQFTDITLDGANVSDGDPLIHAEAGTLQINSGTTMTNGTGGAVKVEGTGDLSINGGDTSKNSVEITLNASALGAVAFSSSGVFSMKNNVTVNDNLKSGTNLPANVFLDKGKEIIVSGDLKSSKIGVTTVSDPQISSIGNMGQADQEIVIAKPGTGYVFDGQCPFVDNFVADRDASGVFASVGTEGLSNLKNTVLKRTAYQIRFSRKDTNNIAITTGEPILPIMQGPGDRVTIPADKAGQAPVGYRLVRVESNSETLNPQMDHSVTGTMPGQEVLVTYVYESMQSQIVFHGNGGYPEPPPLLGKQGDPINSSIPSISRAGYKTKVPGKVWSKANDRNNPRYLDPGIDWARFPDTQMDLYAIFVPDPSVTFDLSAEYAAESGYVFGNRNLGSFSVETDIKSPDMATVAPTIAGYKWSGSKSGTLPDKYNYGAPVSVTPQGTPGETPIPIGSFDSAGTFKGCMPGQDTIIRYRYKVDETKTFPLVIKYMTTQNQIAPDGGDDYNAEHKITVSPLDKYGYRCIGAKIDTGNKTGAFVSTLQGDFDENHVLKSQMPNQPVQITYTYEVTDEGYPLTVRYLDQGSHDVNLQNIVNPVVQNYPSEAPVDLPYKSQYGYGLATKELSPLGSAGSSYLHFETNGDLKGSMFNDSVTVTYQHDRIPAKWKTVTFLNEKGGNGTLSNEGASEDLKKSGNGFLADVLINDQSEAGQEKAYTLEQMEKKGLMPKVQAADGYLFDGWFIDSIPNGILDSSESILAKSHQFTDMATTSETTLYAHFKADPSKWVNVTFAAGEHGLIQAGQTPPAPIKRGTTWGDLKKSHGLPICVPEVNYMQEESWYDGDYLMQDNIPLVDGKTYTARFTKKPDIFGTPTSQPEIQGTLGSLGEGRIIVFNAAEGYRYVLADQEGKVEAYEDGKKGSSRSYFENLQPGSEYQVYEAPMAAKAIVGKPAADIAGISSPAVTLVPVVDTNYQLSYDEQEEGMTRLDIKPANKNSDYAILDSEGKVVYTPQTGQGGWQSVSGSPAIISFSNLGYNKQYTVVARPFGASDITAQSRREYGSVITTDPGGEPKLTNYVMETVDGSISKIQRAVGDGHEIVAGSENTDYFGEAHKGDQVTLTADEKNDDEMPFDHWEIVMGTVDGLKLGQREASFTMPNKNLVLAAVYKAKPSSDKNAAVVKEVRDANRLDFNLSPADRKAMEASLTSLADKVLLNVNKADVTYRVVYQKTGVKASESDAIKLSDAALGGHQQAYKGAWGLNTSIERYVDGRKVPVKASPSNAVFKTYVQLEKNDVDMMDYGLFDVTNSDGGGITPVKITFDHDPNAAGGLFSFDARDGHRYVMAYNRSYRLTFLNETGSIGGRQYRYSFKVLRNEEANDGYGGVDQDQPLGFTSPSGIEYTYEGWSYSQKKYLPFEPDKLITRDTLIHAYYDSNEKQVTSSRSELQDYVDKLIDLSNDYFMKKEESQSLKEFISAAQEVLDQNDSTMQQMKDAMVELKSNASYYEKIIKERYDDYNDNQSNGNPGGNGGNGSGSDGNGGSGGGSGGNGGSGGSGGSGGGSGGGGSGGSGGGSFGGGPGIGGNMTNSSTETAPKTYQVGVDGNWNEVKSPDGTGVIRTFVPNGGTPLTNTWALLAYPKGSGGSAGSVEPGGQPNGNGAQTGAAGWYRFDQQGKVESGWIRDDKGAWYYCNTQQEGDFGKMATGWRQEGADQNLYYLNPASGAMATGWKQIEGKWYYFNPASKGAYSYDSASGQWVYGGGTGRPLGALYKNEVTPDGYHVGPDGAWIH